MTQAFHPEAREGEVCISNCEESDFGSIGWNTKRMGIHAYSIYGTPLMMLRPVFAQIDEVRESEHDFICSRVKRCKGDVI